MTHSNQSISPLRQRMIDDMTLRKLAPKTQAALGAYSTCNEHAAVIKRITRQRNSSLRAPQYL